MEFFLPSILLHYELSSSFRLIDNLSNHFSFHPANYINKESKEAYFHKLDKIFKNTLTDSNTIIVISNASIKKMSLYQYYMSIQILMISKKTIYHTVNIILTETELFAIRCRINQAVQISKISHIIVITDSIYLVKYIFNSTTYSYQIQLIAIA